MGYAHRTGVAGRRITVFTVLACTAGLFALAAPAQATFPGRNGKIAYHSTWSNRTPAPENIFTNALDGSGETRLTTDGTSLSPVWSPDGKRLAFMSHRDTAPWPAPQSTDIYSMNEDGSDVRRLTTDGSSFAPVWSPDGERIAFVTLRDEPDPECCNWEIYVMDADGGGPTRLTDSAGTNTSQSWSPDGTRIVFATNRAGNYDIYSVGIDGSGVTQVTSSPSDETDPQWSPRGSEIAFVRNRHIYIAAPDGSGERPLAPAGTFYDDEPTWSPDGSRIAFVAYTGWDQIHVANADGSGHIALTDDRTPDDTFIPFNRAPIWSPDGEKVAFTHNVCGVYCGGSQIHTINADGSGGRTALSTSNAVTAPDWQPLVNGPPVCAGVTATPSSLRHHRFQTVTLAGATDPDGDAVTITITGVTQDEPVGRRPDARAVASSDQVELRGQRRPRGDGRVYRIAFTASDRTDQCTGVATVEVRRKKKQPAIDSAPPSYDSFGG